MPYRVATIIVEYPYGFKVNYLYWVIGEYVIVKNIQI